MAYSVTKLNIRQARYPELYAYLDDMSRKAKLLRNAALFRIRNNFTIRGKDCPTAHELEVRDEVQALYDAYPSQKEIKSVILGFALEKLMRVTKNPDFFSGLPMQTAQLIVQQACADFQSWLKALKDWKLHPDKYLGKPKMPGYTKSDFGQVPFNNQECLVKNGNLRFPLTDCTIAVSIPDDAVLKEVKCSRSGNDFVLFVTYETMDGIPSGNMPYMAAVDFGVDNLAAVVTDAEVPCLIYKGGAAKAANQWFNKETARLKSCMMQGHDPEAFHCPTTQRMSDLSANRQWFLMDFFHKVAKHLVSWCVANRIGVLILGVSKFWKQESNIGHVNNQNFVQMPFYHLRQMLHYLCDRAGIRCIDQEESYTSKASAIDRDYIPVWRKDNTEQYHFSGRRVHRGLYKTASGIRVNADLNGAANIGRKACPDFLDGYDIASVLRNLNVIRFGALYKVSG